VILYRKVVGVIHSRKLEVGKPVADRQLMKDLSRVSRSLAPAAFLPMDLFSRFSPQMS
jgi:hypothetical protein